MPKKNRPPRRPKSAGKPATPGGRRSTAASVLREAERNPIAMTPPSVDTAKLPGFVEYARLLQVNPLPHLILSGGAIIRALNPAAERLFQQSASEVIARSIGDFMDEAEWFRFMKFLKHAEKLQTILDGHFEIHVGRDFLPVQISVTPVGTPDNWRFNTIVTPLRPSRESEFWLRFHPSHAGLIDAIDGIAWEATIPLRFTFVSSQAQRILGYPARDWITKPNFWEERIHPDDRERTVRARHQAASKGSSHVLEYRMFCADRRLLHVRDSAVVQHSSEGIKLVGNITDITEMRVAQEDLRRSNERLEHLVNRRTAQLEQSLASMENFCYGIAHDLRAPARTIQSFLALLMTDYSERFDPTGRDYAERIIAASRTLDKLIQDLLLYGTLNFSNLNFEPVELGSCIEEAIESLKDEISRKEARLDVGANLPTVYADAGLLRHILVNLLSNALKFTRDTVKPEITIRAQFFSQKQNQPFVRITISDNGIGISPDLQPRIFGIFQRGHHPSEFPGRGVGLAIVKRATELMNGRVGLYSEPGQGSSFWFELPPPSDTADGS